jgi:hypothetical protein
LPTMLSADIVCQARSYLCDRHCRIPCFTVPHL